MENPKLPIILVVMHIPEADFDRNRDDSEHVKIGERYYLEISKSTP